jgi:predicted nucleic acid-binding Zn ribbon protein
MAFQARRGFCGASERLHRDGLYPGRAERLIHCRFLASGRSVGRSLGLSFDKLLNARRRGHLPPERMEDWEQFFDEKSRRRSSKERRRRRERLLNIAILIVFILVAIVVVILLRR